MPFLYWLSFNVSSSNKTSKQEEFIVKTVEFTELAKSREDCNLWWAKGTCAGSKRFSNKILILYGTSITNTSSQTEWLFSEIWLGKGMNESFKLTQSILHEEWVW